MSDENESGVIWFDRAQGQYSEPLRPFAFEGDLLKQVAEGTASNSVKLVELKAQLDRIEGKIDRILIGLRDRGWVK